MREVTLSNGKTVQVAPLTGSQVRTLRKEKKDGLEEPFLIAEMLGIKAEEQDKMPFPDLVTLHKATLAETFGLEEDVKN